MKKVLLLLACLLLLIGHAQEFKIESGPVYEKSHPNAITKIVFATPYGFTTYSYLKNVFMDNQKEITITKYDQQLSAFETKRFNLPKLELRAADLDKVIELENKLIFISNSMSKKKGIRNIYAQVFDGETSTVSDAQIIASYSISSYSKSGQIAVNVSENKQQIAIIANMPFVKKTKQKLKVWTFSNDLKPIWEAEHTLGLDSERAHNQDLHVSNNGLVYLLKRYMYNSKKAATYLITINNKDITEKILSEPNYFLRKTSLVNLGFEHLLTGFYFEGKTPKIDNRSGEGNATTGVFLYDINADKLLGKHAFNVNNKPVKTLTSVAPLFTHVFGDDLYIVGEKQTYTSKFKEDKSVELDYLYTHGPTVFINMDTKGTLKEMQLLNNDRTYKNELNERASVAVLPINGLKTFYNSKENRFRISSFYGTEEKLTWNTPPTKINQDYDAISASQLIPKSTAQVEGYNIVYFASTNANNFWLNKITW